MTIHRPRAFYTLSPQIAPNVDLNYKLQDADLDTIFKARQNPAYQALFEIGIFGIPVLRKITAPYSLSISPIIDTNNENK